MDLGLFSGQPLQRRLFAGHDHIYSVVGAEAVIHRAQKAVRVRGKVDPDDVGLLVDHQVEEPGILMAEAVMVLPPDVRAE